jgi:small-conductance mechanosensitive channel
MKNIFNTTDNQEIITRINKLTSESQALWGKMSVDQMCKHVNEAIIVAFGENTIKVNFIFRLLGRMMKNKVFNSEFQKNSPTAKEFIFTDKYDFEASRNELIKNFSRFAEGHQSIKLMNHPFWGKMTYDDWNKLMWNHVDHHLRQFGV